MRDSRLWLGNLEKVDEKDIKSTINQLRNYFFYFRNHFFVITLSTYAYTLSDNQITVIKAVL